MMDAAVVPTKEERKHAFRNASWNERTSMHQAIAARKAHELAERRKLGQRYLDTHPGGIEIPFDRAVATASLIDQTRAAREEALRISAGRASQYTSQSLEFLALAHDFPADSEAIRIATSPVLLAPIVRYFGMLPVLFNFFVTRAHRDDLNEVSAHHFHLDPEDTISFKAFIHLTEVDAECGPFHALPADSTQRVLEAVGYRGIVYIPDARVHEIVGWDKVVPFVGPPGLTAFADTTRCLHFGGRPRKPGKPVRDMLVFQYLLPTSLLFPIDGDIKHPEFMPQLKANGDPHWDALIGATLT